MINKIQAQKYCSEDISKIENYELAIADNNRTWHCHHKLEIQGEFTNSLKLLKKCGLYYNVPAWQLIFLTDTEHKHLHTHTEATKQKIRIARLGQNSSKEAKQKNREAHLGKTHTEVAKQKIREAKLGENNPMYGQHLSEATKQKMRKAKLGLHWWNNGTVNKRSKECPGPEWKRGML